MCILSPIDALESVLLTNNFEDPSKSTSVELLLELKILDEIILPL